MRGETGYPEEREVPEEPKEPEEPNDELNADNSNPFNPSIYSIESEIQESLEGIKDKSEIISSELVDDLMMSVEEIHYFPKGKIYKFSATSSEIKPHLVG